MISRKKLRRKLKQYYYRMLCFFLNPKGSLRDPYSRSPFKCRLTRMVPGNHNSAACLRIYGDVTEVGFRGWLARKARSNGLECSVKNDGMTISALLIGPGEDVENVIREAWKGPARARVTKIQARWFNRPVRMEMVGGDTPGSGGQDSWSQEVAEQVRQTIKYLGPIMKRPTHYTEVGKFSNAGEIYRAATARNLFVIHHSNINYVASPEKEAGFQNSLSSKITSLIRSITDHKHLTKLLLNERGLPFPDGRIFNDIKDAENYLRSRHFPLVVKPVRGSYGRGITIDVQTIEDMKSAWDYARKYDENIVLEELIGGSDIRVLVVGGTARAALLRVPANVVGDGKNTIEKLVDQKNRERFFNPRLCKSPIIVDARTESFLARQGYSLKSIPPEGEIVFLHLKANLEAGGDSIGVTDQIHPDLLKLAEEAAAAMGTDVYWGIDLMVERIDLPRDQQRCGIIEVNSRANIFNVQFPMYGRPVDVAQAMIDHLFPVQWRDEDYPLETVAVKATGILNEDFVEFACQKSMEYKISGSIGLADSGKSARMRAAGRRHQLLFFLDSLWDWEDDSGIVDGLQIDEYEGAIPEDGFIVEDSFIDSCDSSPGDTDFSSAGELFIDLKPTEYPWANEFAGDLFTLNMQLYLNELERQGCEARQLSEDLIEFKREGLTGITGIYHSSIFCDTVFEKVIPAKKILAFRGLPVRRAARFKGRMRARAIDYYERLSGDCILSSLHPQEVKEYYIDRVSKLRSAWRKARKRGTNNFILEKQPQGWNVCVAVVSDEAAGALLIEPVSVTGDGLSSVEELIAGKNKKRLQNPWYKDKPIEINKTLLERLNRLGFQLEDIPGKGERVPLESRACMEIGGETIAVDHYLHDDFKEKAVEAVKAIPGLNFAFVHMIVPCPDEPACGQPWVISTVETEPLAAMFHYPWKGQPCNIVEKIVAKLCLGEHVIWLEKRDAIE